MKTITFFTTKLINHNAQIYSKNIFDRSKIAHKFRYPLTSDDRLGPLSIPNVTKKDVLVKESKVNKVNGFLRKKESVCYKKLKPRIKWITQTKKIKYPTWLNIDAKYKDKHQHKDLMSVVIYENMNKRQAWIN